MRHTDRSIGRWSWALWLLLCWFLVLAVSGQVSANETSSLTNISEKVRSLKANLLRLEIAWNEQKISLREAERISKELRLELNEVKPLLVSSLESLDLSQQEVKRLIRLLEQSEETLNRLSESFKEYRKTAERQIRRLNIERWIYRVVIGALIVAATWLGLR